MKYERSLWEEIKAIKELLSHVEKTVKKTKTYEMCIRNYCNMESIFLTDPEGVIKMAQKDLAERIANGTKVP